MNHSAIQVQILDAQLEQLTSRHVASSREMKQNLKLALCLVHNLTDFVLREPTLLDIGDRR